MKKLNQVLYSNKFFALIMLLIQIAVFISMFIWITDYSQVIMGFTTLLTAVLIIFETNRTEEPTFKMTWITLVAIIPIFGVLFYLFTRGKAISRNMDSNYKNAAVANNEYLLCGDDIKKQLFNIDSHEASFAEYLERYGGSPAYSDTAVHYYPLGEKMFEDMKRELGKAKKFIFMEFFIINTNDRMWKEIFEILRKKAKSGVEVRVMYDAMGCVGTMPRRYDDVLRRNGIRCRIFSPLVPLLSTHQNNRDHRKILVIDGITAFSGGINIADEYINEKVRFGHWKDTGFMLRGKAVAGFTSMFLEMWNINGDKTEDGGKYILPAVTSKPLTDDNLMLIGNETENSLKITAGEDADNANERNVDSHAVFEDDFFSSETPPVLEDANDISKTQISENTDIKPLSFGEKLAADMKQLPKGTIASGDVGIVIPFGDSPLDSNHIGKRAYMHNLDSAVDHVYVMTPYLVIDNEMYESMKYAAQRGVDVKLILPHKPDKAYAFYLARTYYKELICAGVQIYEYTPGFIHAKMSVCDGRRAIVGTINHDYRSLYLHYECAAYMVNVPAILDIENDFKNTLNRCQKITLDTIKHFNIFTRLLGRIIRLVAPLM